jgi:putative component of membrane protein insertase Oxa1/YidC/SpoIIIJ protein YidD
MTGEIEKARSCKLLPQGFVPRMMLVSMLLAVSAAFCPLRASADGITDIDLRAEARLEAELKPYPFHRLFTVGAIKTYQALLSPSKGKSCPMYPSCSQYALSAFGGHHPARAFAMTADRLLRCGNDVHAYPTIMVDGFIRLYDPPDKEVPSGQPSASGDAHAQPAPESVSIGEHQEPDYPSVVTSVETDSLLLSFADQLYESADFERAITEYKRFLFYYPQSRHLDRCSRSLLGCYGDAGKYEEALAWGRHLLSLTGPDKERYRLYLEMGKLSLEIGDLPQASLYFRDGLESHEPGVHDRCAMLLGLSHARRYDWAAAALVFGGIEPESEYHRNAKLCRELSIQGTELPEKNPTTAGFLAIVPGLGYLYSGFPQTAMAAFVVNSLFIWGSYEGFRADEPAIGSILAFFEAGWYSGNIYGSVVTARRKTTQIREDHLTRFDLGFEF